MNIEDIKSIPEIRDNMNRLIQFLILLKTRDKEQIDKFLKKCRQIDYQTEYKNNKYKTDEVFREKCKAERNLRYRKQNYESV